MLSLKSAIIVHLYLRDMVWKQTAYNINKCDIGLMCLKQRQKKDILTTFVSLSKTTMKRKENEKENNWLLLQSDLRYM